MKRLALVTSLVSVASVWIALLPMWYIFQQFPPEKTLKSFERFGARLPADSSFLLHALTMGKLYVFATLLSAAVIWLGVRASQNANLFAGQGGLVAAWCSVIAATVLWFFQPIFRMGEVVSGWGGERAKSEFTQIQFIMDSLYSAPQQMFMQREGDAEVAIPKEDGERWVNMQVAEGTNKAFCIVYVDAPQPTNASAEKIQRWWPSRLVELSLPMTNEPLTNYALRTLWRCKPGSDLWRPYSITPTWDGKYLMVYAATYGSHTNDSVKPVGCIYDVEQSAFLNAPPATW